MTTPFFSIIIPTYNSAQTLTACLESILNQSFQNFEILIIDGYSTDDTTSIIKKYAGFANSTIKWLSEKDKGIYDAMNKGLKLAKGEWIYFLGSDDKLNNQDVLQKIATLYKVDYDVVYGNVEIIGDTSWAKNGDLYDGIFDFSKLLQKNICHQATFYRMKCFDGHSNIFNIDYTLCADWDFNFRCWAKRNFLFVDLTIADFYGGGETTKNNNDKAFSRDFNKNLLEYFGTDNKNNLELIQKLINKNSVVSGRQSLKNLVKKILKRN